MTKAHLYGFGASGVGCDSQVARVCDLTDCRYLTVIHHGMTSFGKWHEFIARWVDFESIDPFSDHLACHFSEFLGSIANDRERISLHMPKVYVTKTAGRGELRRSSQHSGSRYIAGVDRITNDDIEACLGSSSTIDACKTLVEEQFHVLHCHQGVFFNWHFTERL